ncbi:MAG: ATP-binding cassette domain-containing protein [Actinomycetes bacterium]
MIEIQGLFFARGNHQIYNDFNAQLEVGEAVLLTGPNGAGKSTLIQLIGGLLQAQSGAITIDGVAVNSLNTKEQAMLRAVAPQRRSFTLAFTVKEVLHFLPKKMRIVDNSHLIEKLGLTELLNKKVTELSIGQQERVSLALALSQRAKYYLLDEPFSAQDSEATANIIELINEIKKENGVLVISHNQDAIFKYFDRVISLA